MIKSILSVLTLILSLNILALSQTENIKNDLKRTFRSFDLTRLNRQEMLRENRPERTLTIFASEKTYELAITPRDLRSAEYRAEDTTSGGVRTLERSPVTTFKGTVVGEGGSAVRLTIDRTRIEGYFVSGQGKFFVEPARRFSRFAGDEDVVVYQEKDILNLEEFHCQSNLNDRIEQGRDYAQASGILMNSSQPMRVLQLATDADFEYVNAFGGAVQANNEIMSILNMVEGVFETELNLTIDVVFQHTWSTPDPFGGANTDAVLRNFQSHWNANYPLAQYPRNTAHLFTGKSYALRQGLAFIGAICNNQNFAYGLSGLLEWAPAKFLLTAHEIGHNLGANHADAPQNCADTVMNATLSVFTPFTFCAFSRSEVGNFVSANGSCLRQLSSGSRRFDFDGDGKADPSVYRSSTGVWYIANSASGGFSIFQFGLNGDRPVAADYDGDGKTDAAVYRNGVWYRMRSSNNTFDVINFGLAADIPVPADFDGDNRTDVAVFRPSDGTWHRLNSGNGAYVPQQFGLSGDVPVAADYDGDGRADVNVFRPSNGVWYRLNSGNGSFFATQFGLNGDRALGGDFDGDGRADLAVWRPSNGVWYVWRSSNGSFLVTTFGLSGDLPVVADYDGDGRADIAIFRPSNGTWHRLDSSSNGYATFQFGTSTDIAVPAVF